MKNNIRNLIAYALFNIFFIVFNILTGYVNIFNDVIGSIIITIPLFIYMICTWSTNINLHS